MGKFFSKTIQPKAHTEYIKNEMWRRRQKEKALEEAKTIPQSPDYAVDWIKYKT